MEKASLIIEGKTKKIYAVEGDNSRVIVEYKNTITAFDDPDYTKEFDKKAEYSNTTTCRVFEMLADAGIPVAYEKQLSKTAFVSPKCTMIPLEIVARRYAVGSYLKRHPELATNDGETPHRFDAVRIEFFLKTSKGALTIDGTRLVDGLDPKNGEEDPLIRNPQEKTWQLFHPKKPGSDPQADLHKSVASDAVLPDGVTTAQMADITQEVFLALENYWAQHDFKFIDFKIECGVNESGELLVADVIDNDSWRLRDKNWNDVSKQSFRDGEDLGSIENKYALVATLLEKTA